jgi:hypothetical protein
MEYRIIKRKHMIGQIFTVQQKIPGGNWQSIEAFRSHSAALEYAEALKNNRLTDDDEIIVWRG